MIKFRAVMNRRLSIQVVAATFFGEARFIVSLKLGLTWCKKVQFIIFNRLLTAFASAPPYFSGNICQNRMMRDIH